MIVKFTLTYCYLMYTAMNYGAKYYVLRTNMLTKLDFLT